MESYVSDESDSPSAFIGRPTTFKTAYVDQAYRLSLLGLTGDRLARFFECSVSTFRDWMHDNEDLRDAVHRGRDLADADVASSLHSRAKGMSIRRTKVSINSQGQVTEHTYDEEMAPDVSAATHWLAVRQPKLWRPTTQIQNLDENGNPVSPPSLTILGAMPGSIPRPTEPEKVPGQRGTEDGES